MDEVIKEYLTLERAKEQKPEKNIWLHIKVLLFETWKNTSHYMFQWNVLWEFNFITPKNAFKHRKKI